MNYKQKDLFEIHVLCKSHAIMSIPEKLPILHFELL